MEIFKRPREMSARVTSWPHWIGVLRVRTTTKDSGESYRGGTVTFRSAEGDAWAARACSQRKRRDAWRRVDGRLVPALVGVTVTRSGAPDSVVPGENWGGQRRRAYSQRRRWGAWWHVDRRLVLAPVGVAVARRGAPDSVVAGENLGGRRRRPAANSGGRRRNSGR